MKHGKYMKHRLSYRIPYFVFMLIFLLAAGVSYSQSDTIPTPVSTAPPVSERAKKWGPNDTLVVPAIWYEGEMMPYKELEMVWVSNMSARKLAKHIEKWNRLRNAVYVTYPYARTAGYILNDMNAYLATMPSKNQQKEYIKTREKELKARFTDPISNLSVYQGRVLMKLINRQTGNNCYNIIKEYRGSFSARFWQSILLIFGSSLKQDYDMQDATDRQIENFVAEIDGVWYNPYTPIP